MAYSRTFYSITLIVALISLSTRSCLGTIDLLGIGFGVPLDNPCLSSFVTGQSCIQELVSSFLVLQPKLLGPQCCKSALAVDENCWPKIFPLNPYFPPQIKDFCLTVVGPLTPPVLPVQPAPVVTLPPPVITPPVTTLPLPPPVISLPPPVITPSVKTLPVPPPVISLPPPVTTLPPPVTTLPPPVTTLPPPVTTLPPPVTTLPPPVATVQPPLPASPVVPAPPSARPAP